MDRLDRPTADPPSGRQRMRGADPLSCSGESSADGCAPSRELERARRQFLVRCNFVDEVDAVGFGGVDDITRREQTFKVADWNDSAPVMGGSCRIWFVGQS